MLQPCHSRLVCASCTTSHATALTVTTLARVPKKAPLPPVLIGIGAGFGMALRDPTAAFLPLPMFHEAMALKFSSV